MPKSAIANGSDVIRDVSGSRLMKTARGLAKWQKYSGTPEELTSLKWLRKQFDAIGFHTKILMHDAYISLPGKARLIVDGNDVECITHSFSRVSKPGGLSARVIDLGAGNPADYAGKDVKGAIVMLDGMATPWGSRRATEAGAAGQIQVNIHEHTHEMCVSPVWGSPTPETLHLLPETVIASVTKSRGEKIREALKADPGLAVTIHTDVDTRWRKTPVLVAELASPKGKADEPFIFFTGHHDTWHYGVMDNGTANATMLEVARVCAERRKGWRRGLRLCFWSGHSHGRYAGSTWYCDNHWEELHARAAVHVNCDSTGGRGATNLANAVAAAELQPLAAQSVFAVSGQKLAGDPMARNCDQSFWGAGLPSMYCSVSKYNPKTPDDGVLGRGDNLASHGLGWWWHTPEDLIDKIDEKNLTVDTQVFADTMWKLLSADVVPLDYAAHARYFQARLKALSRGVGKRFDTSLLLKRSAALEAASVKLSARARKAKTAKQFDRINRALLKVSRAIVPVDYTRCCRFDHDPAMPMGTYPSLEPLAKLASAPRGSDEEKLLINGLTRARNRVAYAYAAAAREIEACLKEV